MESSQFTDSQSPFESLEPLDTQGATCDTFRVKLYGKLHFLKRLKPAYAGDIRYQEAFRKEFETGYRLEHPHLVRYITLNDDGILMEYVDGETLTQRLARQPEYFRKRRHLDKFISQLLDVVGYLHSNQVLHLDLKPDNILLTRINDDVKLVDLGCCYTDTFTDTSGCTPAFAAPEQLPSQAGVGCDVRTDIYAIGRILELLPNHHIFNKVIARCTAPDKADRYPSVEHMAKALDRQRRPYLIVVVAAVLLIAAVVAVLLFGRHTEVAPSTQKERADTMPAPTVLTPQEPDSQVEVATATAPPTLTLPTAPASDDALSLPTVTMSGEALPTMTPDSLKLDIRPIAPTQAPPSETVATSKDTPQTIEQELDKLINTAYRSTIASFCDSVFPSITVGRQWERQSSEFHAQVLQIAADVARRHPDILESVVIQQTESRFMSLVGYVFNRMRENGERLSETEME